MARSNRFLILGCQRSGNTVLGLALEAHPSIEIVEEDNSRFHRTYGLTKQLDLEAVLDYEPGAGKIVGYKAPRDTHRVKKIIAKIPEIKLIWISRDVYQVVASMINLQFGPNLTWATALAPREILKYLHAVGDDHEISSEYQVAKSLCAERDRAVALASVCWLAKRRTEFRVAKAWPSLVKRLSYDSLVCSPGDILADLLDFLGATWNPAVLDHPRMLRGDRPGATSTKRPIDTKSVDVWKNDLSTADLKLIDKIIERHQGWLAAE